MLDAHKSGLQLCKRPLDVILYHFLDRYGIKLSSNFDALLRCPLNVLQLGWINVKLHNLNPLSYSECDSSLCICSNALRIFIGFLFCGEDVKCQNLETITYFCFNSCKGMFSDPRFNFDVISLLGCHFPVR